VLIVLFGVLRDAHQVRLGQHARRDGLGVVAEQGHDSKIRPPRVALVCSSRARSSA